MSGGYGDMPRVTPIRARDVPRDVYPHVDPATPTVTPLGAELRRLRGRVSQSRLANVIGVDHTYISRIESSNRHPSRNVVLGIIAALELDKATAAKLLNLAGYTAGIPNHPVADELALFLTQPDMDADFRTACEVVTRDTLDQMRAGWAARQNGRTS